MANSFKFDLVSPERQLISDEVEQVVVPGAEGDFGVLEGHAPFMSTLRPGVMEIIGGNSDGKRVFVRGGFAEVDPTRLTVLAQTAISLEDLDVESLDQEIKNVEEDLADAKSEAARLVAQEALDRLNDLRESL